MGKRGGWMVGATILSVLVLMVGVAGAAEDPGWYAGHSSEEQQAIVDYMYERSGHATVPYEGDAETTADAISQDVIGAAEEDAPLAPSYGLTELVVAQDVGLLARLGTIAPQIAVGVGTFGVGVAIGTGIRKVFMRLTGPDDLASGGTWSWNSLEWQPYGTEVFYGATVQQRPGAYVYNAGYSGFNFPIARWFESPCDFSGFSAPNGGRLQTHVSSLALCNEYSEVDREFHLYPVFVDYPYLLESDLYPMGPFLPFDAENDVPDYTIERPPDPGAEAVEANLGAAIDADGSELMREETDWATTPGSQAAEEPIRVGAPPTSRPREDRECKEHFGDAPGEDPGARAPGAEEEAADWDHDVDSFREVFNPLIRGTQTVKLRWGNKAWGYRHIVIRHGWNAGSARRTRLALQTDLSPTLDAAHDNSDQSFVYIYEIPGSPEGIHCRQRVAVSYRTDAAVPVGRHIITSFVEAY